MSYGVCFFLYSLLPLTSKKTVFISNFPKENCLHFTHFPLEQLLEDSFIKKILSRRHNKVASKAKTKDLDNKPAHIKILENLLGVNVGLALGVLSYSSGGLPKQRYQKVIKGIMEEVLVCESGIKLQKIDVKNGEKVLTKEFKDKVSQFFKKVTLCSIENYRLTDMQSSVKCHGFYMTPCKKANLNDLEIVFRL
ncbi:hypothetical protein FF38_11164 [Lucilia cuprina]|uniref:Uncharacterized protein n=1 Tax=Lucilia cuprina TaxID=7375 RepID=A0A0L0BY00_LUCCU|nr:hypothetical protein FF38_11164 [Lucilia cuprina]